MINKAIILLFLILTLNFTLPGEIFESHTSELTQFLSNDTNINTSISAYPNESPINSSNTLVTWHSISHPSLLNKNSIPI